jgi:hypothetical protein
MDDVWKDDLLDFQSTARNFTNLIKSIDSAKVISIESGYGRGKTFFRKNWAQDLRAAGEKVVEIDVRKSDHSGDPVVTLIAALVREAPRNLEQNAKAALEAVKKLSLIGAKVVTKAVLRSGADDLIEHFEGKGIENLGDFKALDDVVRGVGDEMSKVASHYISSQLAAEKVRIEELPNQLKALYKVLKSETETDRVIVIVDELDRCHPDYALSFIESMKLIFETENFVFVLMVDAHYLQKIAEHRFGQSDLEELYLEKFVDIRLRLHQSKDAIQAAATQLARELPLVTPLSDDPAFSLEAAAEFLGSLSRESGLSFRKIERILLRVRLVLVCYKDTPIDLPLIIFLIFKEASPDKISKDMLPRAKLTPDFCKSKAEQIERDSAIQAFPEQSRTAYEGEKWIKENAPMLEDLDRVDFCDRQQRPYYLWYRIYKIFGPTYIPSHEKIIEITAKMVAE